MSSSFDGRSMMTGFNRYVGVKLRGGRVDAESVGVGLMVGGLMGFTGCHVWGIKRIIHYCKNYSRCFTNRVEL